MDYANQIFTQIESIHEMLFKIPLWVDAKEGRLTTNQLKGLLKESYHSGGPININMPAMIVNAPNLEKRMRLANVLVEELPHPNLNFKMAKSIGLSQDEIKNHNPHVSTKAFTAWRVNMFHFGTYAENRCVSLLTEGWLLKMSSMMVTALGQHHNLKREETGLYAEHSTADEPHVAEAKEDITEYVNNEEEFNRCRASVQDGGGLMKFRYDSYYKAYA